MPPVPDDRRYVADLSTETCHDRWCGVCPDLETLVRTGAFRGAGIGLDVRDLCRQREAGALPGYVVGGHDCLEDWRHGGLGLCTRCFVQNQYE